ncbi:cysteine desulfurase family protein [Kyrpidia sp.]|uniref:cysteine desulfurase family protein n=1 Tax=Kyrpidia sp. TaxID=2073077 RepID=UPI00338D4174
MKRLIYLDNSATTRPLPEVVEAATAALREQYGNPSSAHRLGLAAEDVIEDARADVARLLGVKAKEIVFTSGGTEAINAALVGTALAHRGRGKHIVTTAVEHAAVLETCGFLEQVGFEVTRVPPEPNGVVDARAVLGALREDTILVSVMHVNNETGAIQPVQTLGQQLKRLPKVIFHIDAVQSFGKLAVPLTGVDLISLSAHKIHGPKGAGALYIREGLKCEPLLHGGGQEAGRRSGTPGVPAIAGMGAACRWWLAHGQEAVRQLSEIHAAFIEVLRQKVPGHRLNSPPDGAPHIVNLSFPGFKGEVLVHALEERGVYVSTASACSSRSAKGSHVLRAMGVAPEVNEGALRFSFSPFNTVAEMEEAGVALAEVVKELRPMMRR